MLPCKWVGEKGAEAGLPGGPAVALSEVAFAGGVQLIERGSFEVVFTRVIAHIYIFRRITFSIIQRVLT